MAKISDFLISEIVDKAIDMDIAQESQGPDAEENIEDIVYDIDAAGKLDQFDEDKFEIIKKCKELLKK